VRAGSGELTVGQALHGRAVDDHRAGCGPVQRCHQVHEGRFAGARCAGDGHHVAGFDAKVDAPDGLDRRLAGVALSDFTQLEDGHHFTMLWTVRLRITQR
jgi:hypothetical protein